MWTTVYVATGHDWALEVENKLKNEGFLVKIKRFSDGGGDDMYEILTPKYEATDVQSALIELGIL